MKNLILFISLFIVTEAFAVKKSTRPVNLEQIIDQYNLNDYLDDDDIQKGLRKIKIAVLDNGFGTLSQKSKTSEINKYLPKNTKIVENFGNATFQGNYDHGLRIAQIVWYMLNADEKNTPQLYLLNANGYANFKDSIEYSIKEKVDIIVYSKNWTWAGNFDGKGIINAEVNKATKAGILWINSAGNYGNQVKNIQLSDEDNESTIENDQIDFKVNADEQDIKITTAWNDFGETLGHKLRMDLDFEIIDENNKVVGRLNDVQIKRKNYKKEVNFSKELKTFKLDKGDYSLKIINKTKKTYKNSMLRVYIQAPKNPSGVEFVDIVPTNEITIPADNPNVITVGSKDRYSSKGPTADGRIKPEILLPSSSIEFSNDMRGAGTSASAPQFAAMAALLLAENPKLTRNKILKKLELRKTRNVTKVIDYNDPILPTSLAKTLLPRQVRQAIASVSVNMKFIRTNQRLRVLIDSDPSQIKNTQNQNVFDVSKDNKNSHRYYVYYQAPLKFSPGANQLDNVKFVAIEKSETKSTPKYYYELVKKDQGLDQRDSKKKSNNEDAYEVKDSLLWVMPSK